MSKSKPNCPKTGTDTHAGSCYKTTYPGCGIKQHEHVNRACYYQKGPNIGQLKCPEEAHEHNRRDCTSVSGPLCGGR